MLLLLLSLRSPLLLLGYLSSGTTDRTGFFGLFRCWVVTPVAMCIQAVSEPLSATYRSRGLDGCFNDVLTRVVVEVLCYRFMYWCRLVFVRLRGNSS